MYNTDQPINSATQDLLGRTKFAYALGDTLLAYENINSIVIGLFGSWGTGKTSILNLAQERIDNACKEQDKKPVIIKFNPWNFSGQNQLIFQFFNSLSQTLKRNNNSELLQNIGNKFEIFSTIFTPISFISEISGLRLLTSAIGAGLKSWGKLKKQDLDQIKEELNKLLKKIPNKIVIIIDDIDRLTPTEIRQIFQLVKKIGDFPNTIYVLACDKDVVLNAFQVDQIGYGNQYLEKIVQVPFEIPPISKDELYSLLFNRIDQIIKEIPQEKFDSYYFGNIFHSGVKYLFSNVRDVSRYINTLSFNFPLIKNDVNTIDFLAINAIQVFLPQLYYFIRDNKDLFVGSSEDISSTINNNEDDLKTKYDLLYNDNSCLSEKQLQDFLARLFPKLNKVFKNINYGDSWEGEWRKNRRICSPEIFDTYFRLSIPKNDISQNDMELILSKANNIEEFTANILKLKEENKVIRFLNILEDYTRDENIIPLENIERIVSVLMEYGDGFPNKDFGGYLVHIDTPMQIMRLFYQLLHRFENQYARFQILKNSIESTESSIFTYVEEISLQNQQHEKYPKNTQSEPAEKLTLNSDQLIELEKIVVKKIQNWAESSKLSTHEKLGYILYRWRDWEDIDSVKIYVSNLIKEDKGLIKFISGFLNKSMSFGGSDYQGKEIWHMRLKEINDFTKVDEIEPRIRKISKSSIVNDFTENGKKAIEVFLDTFDGKTKKII